MDAGRIWRMQGGAAEGEDDGDVHGIKGGEEGVGRLALASWGHGCCYRSALLW